MILKSGFIAELKPYLLVQVSGTSFRSKPVIVWPNNYMSRFLLSDNPTALRIRWARQL
jgi:hypothetical protein